MLFMHGISREKIQRNIKELQKNPRAEFLRSTLAIQMENTAAMENQLAQLAARAEQTKSNLRKGIHATATLYMTICFAGLEALQIADGLQDMKGKKILGVDLSKAEVAYPTAIVFFALTALSTYSYVHSGIERFYENFLKESYLILSTEGCCSFLTYITPKLFLTALIVSLKATLDGMGAFFSATDVIDIIKIPAGIGALFAIGNGLFVLVTDGIANWDLINGVDDSAPYTRIAKPAAALLTVFAVLSGILSYNQAVLGISLSLSLTTISILSVIGSASSFPFLWQVTTDFLDITFRSLTASLCNFIYTTACLIPTSLLAIANYQYFEQSFNENGGPKHYVPFAISDNVANFLAVASSVIYTLQLGIFFLGVYAKPEPIKLCARAQGEAAHLADDHEPVLPADLNPSDLEGGMRAPSASAFQTRAIFFNRYNSPTQGFSGPAATTAPHSYGAI